MNPLEMEKQPRLMSLNDVPGGSPKAVALSKKNLSRIPDAEKAILARLDPLLTAMFDLALGHFHTVSKFNKDTGEVETRVYEVSPDFKALAFLIENVLGKVPQRLEMTGDGGGPIQIIPWMTTSEAMREKLLHKAQEQEQEEEEVTEGEYTVTTEAAPDGE